MSESDKRVDKYGQNLFSGQKNTASYLATTRSRLFKITFLVKILKLTAQKLQ